MERIFADKEGGREIAETIFEAIADPIFVIDFEGDGLGPTFRYVNEATCRLLGRTREELLRLRPGTVDEIDEAVMDVAFERLLRVGRATFESLMIAGDGRRIPVEIHASDARLEGKRVCIAVARSLVRRKAMEEELKEAKQAAEKASQAKSEFLATMSHEIRTPLHGVVGFASLLEDGELPEKQREAVEGIRDSANLLEALVTDVLDFSRIEAGRLELQPREVDVARQVRRIAGAFRLRAEGLGLAFRFTEAPNLPALLLTDALRIEQVLGNLLGNALKFTERGEIGLDVTAHETPEGWRIAFAVTDTGIGISADQVERLFHPFTQADSSLARRHGGSGLGLVIVRRLCEMMGGTVTVRSEAGRGSVFTATIVALAATGREAPVRAQSGSYEVRADRTLRLLVADDNALNRKLMSRMIARLGYEAEFATNGREAVEMSAAHDLIFMDVSMPEVDGLEATRQIRRREQKSGKRARIVALTAGISDEERTACAVAGMDDFLGKPFTEEGLRAAISRALAGQN